MDKRGKKDHLCWRHSHSTSRCENEAEKKLDLLVFQTLGGLANSCGACRIGVIFSFCIF